MEFMETSKSEDMDLLVFPWKYPVIDFLKLQFPWSAGRISEKLERNERWSVFP